MHEEVRHKQNKENLMRGVRELVSDGMNQKEIDHLVNELFSESLEQDSWLNSY